MRTRKRTRTMTRRRMTKRRRTRTKRGFDDNKEEDKE